MDHVIRKTVKKKKLEDLMDDDPRDYRSQMLSRGRFLKYIYLDTIVHLKFIP